MLGNSKLLMDWANGNYQISNFPLGLLMEKFMEVKS